MVLFEQVLKVKHRCFKRNSVFNEVGTSRTAKAGRINVHVHHLGNPMGESLQKQLNQQNQI
jgi:hypothetical protein